MPSTPEPSHLNSHHRDTLIHIFQHPTGGNIEWHDVLSLLEAVAKVKENKHGKFVVTLGGDMETIEPPRHKDIDIQLVVTLRRMLKSAGYGPEAGGATAGEAGS